MEYKRYLILIDMNIFSPCYIFMRECFIPSLILFNKYIKL